MCQKENQPIDDFIAELQHQAVMCDFGDKHDCLLGDRIMVGFRDTVLRERLVHEKDLTLEKIIATCRSAEISKQHVTSLATTSHEQEATVARLSKGKQFRQLDKHHTRRQPAYHLKNGQPTETAAQRTCAGCGTVHQPRQCPAYGSTCYNCGKFGHFTTVSRQKERTIQKKVHVFSDQGDDPEQELFLENLTVDIVESASSDRFECVEVNGRLVNFKLDTSSDVNILSEQLVLNWNPQSTVKATNAKVTTYLAANDGIFEHQAVVTPYFDDILVASKTPDEHVVHLRKVLSTARANNLKLNYNKVKLGLPTVTYLGHQLTQQGVTPDPSKVKAINAIPAPTCKAELLRFLGMATYLMKFVPNFSAKTQPLQELLKSDVAWHWMQKMTDAFNDIKSKLTTAPVLHYFDPAVYCHIH
nr:LOW QUALITY PROTEIN: uncharacterized protein LOC119181197 [Rhipicephalus microplus]